MKRKSNKLIKLAQPHVKEIKILHTEPLSSALTVITGNPGNLSFHNSLLPGTMNFLPFKQVWSNICWLSQCSNSSQKQSILIFKEINEPK